MTNRKWLVQKLLDMSDDEFANGYNRNMEGQEMGKGKLIVEIEKADGEIRTANLKITDMTVEELSHVVGAVLNDVIGKGTRDEAEKVIWKAYALHDICVQIGFKSVAARLEEAIDKMWRVKNNDD